MQGHICPIQDGEGGRECEMRGIKKRGIEGREGF